MAAPTTAATGLLGDQAQRHRQSSREAEAPADAEAATSRRRLDEDDKVDMDPIRGLRGEDARKSPA
jgi:hypothetical protein